MPALRAAPEGTVLALAGLLIQLRVRRLSHLCRSPAPPGVCSRPGRKLRLQEGLRGQEELWFPPRVLPQR